MLLGIDNYDSFPYNLVQYFGELGAELEVVRNDQITLDEIAARRPQAIVLGPGPGTHDATDIHAVQHVAHPVFGVQFHPESIGTAAGMRMLKNFLTQAKVT